jgi:hypothetical protein
LLAEPRCAGQKLLIELFIHNYVKFNSNSGWACSTDGWCEVSPLLLLLACLALLACLCVTVASRPQGIAPWHLTPAVSSAGPDDCLSP